MHPKNIVRGAALLPLLLFMLATLACQSAVGPQAPSGPAAGGGEPKQGGIATIATRGDPPGTWDPMVIGTITLGQVANGAFSQGNVVRLCREDVYKVCPGLAESWQANPDFTQWTFKLRPGVKWSDATPLTPEDIVFWVDLAFNGVKVGDKVRAPATYRSSFGDLKQVVALPDGQVRFDLTKPTPYYLSRLAGPNNTVSHPRHLMQARIQQGEVNIGPSDVGWVGLGPFRVTKHEKGSLVQVRRNENYWEKDAKGRQLPYLDGIDFPIITDPNAMVAAFRTGRLDSFARGTGFGVQPEQRKSIEQALGDQVMFAETAGYRWHLHFNVLRAGPWQDLRVRRAMELWMNKRDAVQALTGGSSFIHTLMDPRSGWPNPDWESWPGYSKDTRDKDRAEAKRLLAEAGYPNGFSMFHLCRAVWGQICEWIQGDLSGLGVKVTYQLNDDATWQAQNRSTTDWDTQMTILNTTFPEALENTLGTASRNVTAAPKHEDAKVDQLFDKFRLVKNQDERVANYRELERYILRDQVYSISLFEELLVMPYRSYLKGLNMPPEDVNHNMDHATTWLDK